MSWIQLKIKTTDQFAEQFSLFLENLGALSVTFQDQFDTPVFEPELGTTELWRNTEVVGLFNDETDVAAIEHKISASFLAPQIQSIKIEELEDQVWERAWMDEFHPIKFGNRLWICPSWCDVPDPDAVNVMLDPGLAFGTGTHPTTALCLTWLDGLDLTDKTVVDFGCGSGILAIAALKLGAKQVIGIDIDPQALEASLENAKRNQVESGLTLYLAGNEPSDLQADIVVANILAGPLKELAKPISKLVQSKGYLGLSGILTEQAQEVCRSYAQDFILDSIATKEEWCRITGIKESE